VYLTDAALLERLAQDKLAGIAAEVKRRRLGVGGCHAGRDPCRPARLPACAEGTARAEQARSRSASRSCKPRCTNWPKPWMPRLDADDEDKADALQEEGETVGEQLQALEDGLQDYGANVKAAAGAIVTIDRNGEAVIHRGLMREAEAKALRTLERLRQGFGSEAKPRTTTKARTETTTGSPRPPPCPTGWRSG
jgi:ParB family chromosome partitioning protein